MWSKETTRKISDESAKRLKDKLIKRGFEVLSVKGTGKVQDRLFTLRCSVGHKFTKNGHRLWTREKCPMCYCSSVEENAARLLIEAHFNKPFPNVRPEWFLSEEGQIMELDMFNEELKLAFEYNGVHHYEPIFGEEALQKTQKRDNYKKELCAKFGIKLIHIKAIKRNTSKKKLIAHITEELANHNIVITEKLQQKVVNTNLVDGKTTGADLFTSLLKTLHFELIDGVYENRFSRMKIMHKCGKVYSISYKEVMRYHKKREICTQCNSIVKEKSLLKDGEKANSFKGNKRKKAGFKRAEIVGKEICSANDWTYQGVNQNKHGHLTFEYLDNGEVKIYPKKKYNLYVRENNLSIVFFEKQQEVKNMV